MATDLHSRLVEATTARLNLAGSATSGPWTSNDPMMRDAVWAEAVRNWIADCRFEQMGPFAIDNAAFIAANDPAFVAGACRADLELLEQHAPPLEQLHFPTVKCRAMFCGEVWPCTLVRNRAGVYGVNLDEQEG